MEVKCVESYLLEDDSEVSDIIGLFCDFGQDSVGPGCTPGKPYSHLQGRTQLILQ